MTPGDTWVSFFFPLGFPDLETGSGVSVIRMGAGRTVGPHCVIFFPRPTVYSIYRFPDLETGSCRWGSSNCGGSPARLSVFGNRFVLRRGGRTQLCHLFFYTSTFGNTLSVCHLFLIPLGFPDLETGSCVCIRCCTRGGRSILQ